MALGNYTFVDFFENTGGINTVSSAIRLKKSECRDSQDMDYFPIGGFTKRNGYALLNSTPVGAAACTGLYQARYSLNGGTNFEYLVSGTKLYSMPGSLNGTWTDITGGLTITTGQNNLWNFSLLNDICVLGNGTDTPIQISSTPTASALTSGLPFTCFLFPIEWRGYMWYFRPTVAASINYDRAYFSSINDPATVSATNFVDIGKGQGGDIKGAVNYNTYLYVFKRNGIYQIIFQPTAVDSSGNIFPFSNNPNPIVPNIGTQSHRSIVKFTTPTTHATPGQELVFFIDQFGCPRIFDGTTTISFSSKIGLSRDGSILSLTNMDATRTAYCFSINYPAKNKILFFLSKVNSQQDTCWIMDYSTGFSIGRYKYASAFNCGTLFEKSDGTFKPYFGDYAGSVFQSDSGTTDNGSAISDYYIIGDSYVKSPSINSKWFDMDIKGITGSTSQSATISYYPSNSDTPAKTDAVTLADPQAQWGTAIWGQFQWAKQGLASRTSEINITSKTMRVKIESTNKATDSLSVEGFTLIAESLGTSQD